MSRKGITYMDTDIKLETDGEKKEPTYKEKFEHLKRIHDATNTDVKRLYGEISKRDEEIKRLMAQLQYAQDVVMEQKQITFNYISDAEAYKRSLEEEIAELRALASKED